jgi:pyrimidine-specific ribonucleoside hydrolase
VKADSAPRARRVLIDTDPGLDDLLALALAAASPELEIAGLTSVAGNASLDAVHENAARFCALAGLDVPLGRGAAGPLELEPGFATHFHGTDGRRGLALPAPRAVPEVGAAELLRECLRGRAVDCVIALGPLTNLGPLAAAHPGWFEGIPVYWMGGSLTGGNVTPAAEFNCWADPRAAALLLGSGVEVTAVGLDVTGCVALGEDALSGAPFGSGARARFLESALAHLMDAERLVSGRRCAVLHDPVAIFAALESGLLCCERRRLAVSVVEGPERGRLAELPDAYAPGVRWARALDRERVVERFLSRLRTWARAGDRA